MGSVSITDCRDCTSAAMTTQNKQEHLGVCLQERAQDQLSKRPVQLFCRLPLERWVKKKKPVQKTHVFLFWYCNRPT